MAQSKLEIEARQAMVRLKLHPTERPMGDDHHTDAPFEPHDNDVAELAYWLGGLFIDKESDPDQPMRESYFYNEMTSIDVWLRVARALRIHGLKIVDADL